MLFLKIIILIIFGLSSGVVISGGIFAFIAMLGVVPRLAQKTKTEKYISFYEDCILYGGIFGGINIIRSVKVPLGIPGLLAFGLLSGIFIGCVAVSIAEVLDVVPILTRRFSLKTGLTYLMLAVAIGKLLGALLYFLIPGFNG